MRKIDERKTRFYFAADSDIIITLEKLSRGIYDKVLENPYLRQRYEKLWQMVYSGDVKLYVTPQVLSELGEKVMQYTYKMASRSEVALFIGPAKFVRSFCYPIYISPRYEDSFQEKAKHLADRYCLEADFDGVVSHDADGNAYVIPAKDAKVLAEASLCGLTLLTCNTVDMILSDEEGVNPLTKLSKIEQINIDEGLGYNGNCLWKNAPVPMSLANFFKHLPDCYMDEPFLPDTHMKVKDLDPSEVMWQSREQYEKFYKFMYFVENTKNAKVEPVGIENPYEYIIDGKKFEYTKETDDGKNEDE